MENIITETLDGSIIIIRLNKPRKKNAIDLKMYQRVTSILKEVSEDDNINVVVLTGTGDFYSAGNDLTAFNDYEGDYDLYPVLLDFIKAFIEFPKVLIAIVNGPAIGVAVTTLAFCDLVFASEDAYFSTPFTKLGIVPEGCSSYTFTRIMGERKAVEMLMFNYIMPAKEALQCGLVNDLYKPEDIQHKVWDRIDEVTKLRNTALLESKKLLKGPIKDYLLKLTEIELKVVNDLHPLKKSKL